jgi:predicted lipoprotein
MIKVDLKKSKNTLNGVVMGLLMIAIFMGLTNCGGKNKPAQEKDATVANQKDETKNISDIATKYVKAILDLDYQEAKKYAVEEVHASYEEIVEQLKFDGAVNAVKLVTKVAKCEIKEISQDGDRATVIVKISGPYQWHTVLKDRNVYMVKRGDQWKVDEGPAVLWKAVVNYAQEKGFYIDETE